MPQLLGKLRKAAVAVVAALSVLMAVFLVWHLVTPTRIGSAPVVELLGVLALLVLPGVTMAAWELDRRAASSIEIPAAESNPEIAPARQARIHERPAHAAHAEPRHRRRVPGERPGERLTSERAA